MSKRVIISSKFVVHRSTPNVTVLFRRRPPNTENIAIFDRYLALGSVTAGASSAVNSFDGGVRGNLQHKAAASVYRTDCHDEKPRISEFCLWQQASTSSPKRTERNVIVRIGKSEAEVTNNRRLRSRYSTSSVEANYRCGRSIARPLCDGRASCSSEPMFVGGFWFKTKINRHCSELQSTRTFGTPSTRNNSLPMNMIRLHSRTTR